MTPVLHAFLSQTADGPTGGNALTQFVPFIFIAVLFYFIFFRPQQKQQKDHQAFLAGMQKGTEVVTQGGVIGTVVLVEDRTVTLDVGGGNKLRVVKANVLGAWQDKPVTPAKQEKK